MGASIHPSRRRRRHHGGVAVTIAGRTSLAGAEMQLLVLAGGQRWCTAIDLGTGALVSARWERPDRALTPLVVAHARLDDDQDDADPVRPEEVTLSRSPRVLGRTTRRRAERWLRPVLHPKGEHLLGFAGPAAPYWTLDGTRPTVAVVAPTTPPRMVGDRCRFSWRNVAHSLPVLPRALAASPHKPRRLVVTLSAPRQGHCYKLVAAVL